MERLGLYEASLKAIKYHNINLTWKHLIPFTVKKKKKEGSGIDSRLKLGA